ncbi:hypothetical protein NPIL_426181 [Nephila pilipes]|uniref:Uncharacterized protein n=1 Tax=Nephila pilipes TaxID=299642 RepID=A0A8X6TPW3_NEPPI|nr:hypothetical protein NPIL_426181 [Nephila pilipes]
MTTEVTITLPVENKARPDQPSIFRYDIVIEGPGGDGQNTMVIKLADELLLTEQKQLILKTGQRILETMNSNPNILNNTVITGDELWTYRYDPEEKMQLSLEKQPTSPWPK